MTPTKLIIVGLCQAFLVYPAFSQRTGHADYSYKKSENIDNVTSCQHLPADFKVDFNVCNQYEVQFKNESLSAPAVSWDFGDGGKAVGNDMVAHVYKNEGVYTARLVVFNQNGCNDTIFKKFLLSIDKGHLFATKELNVCKGTPVKMQGDADAVENCWSPGRYLSAIDIPDPVCTPMDSIAYQYNVIEKDKNVIPNGAFSFGNSGFSSDYKFDSLVSTSGNYFVGTKPRQWNPLYQNCLIDTINMIWDTMMMVNGSGKKGLIVWEATASVVPNTNYIFSVFTEPLTFTDSIVLEISINKGQIIGRTEVPRVACNRQRYASSWYSDTNTTVHVSITDLDTNKVKNNFALDSISLKAIYLRTDSIKIVPPPDPVFSVQPLMNTVCAGDSITLTASGGDIYSWSPSGTVAQPGAASTAVFPLANTTYKVVVTSNACNVTDSLFATVLIKPKPITSVSKSNDLNCVVLESNLQAMGGINYHWNPENTLSNAFAQNPVATPHETTVYHVDVTGENGCVATDSVQVQVTNDGVNGFLVASAFTPNNDGLNDCFGLRKWGNVAGLQFFIYDRWGKVVFYSTDAFKCWDGYYKNTPQPSGTYVYRIRGSTVCGYVERKGTVVLIR